MREVEKSRYCVNMFSSPTFVLSTGMIITSNYDFLFKELWNLQHICIVLSNRSLISLDLLKPKS